MTATPSVPSHTAGAALTDAQLVKLWGPRSDCPDNHEIISFARAVLAASPPHTAAPVAHVVDDVCGGNRRVAFYSNKALYETPLWTKLYAAPHTAAPDRRQVAFDGSPEDLILRLRANLRAVTDAYEDLIEAGTFPPKGRSADDKESRNNWWEDASVRIKQARKALEDSHD